MTDTKDNLTHITRAMMVGAMVGGAVSIAERSRARKAGEISPEEYLSSIAKDTARAGMMSGITTVVAGKVAGQSWLNLATALAVGAAGVCVLEQKKGSKADE